MQGSALSTPDSLIILPPFTSPVKGVRQNFLKKSKKAENTNKIPRFTQATSISIFVEVSLLLIVAIRTFILYMIVLLAIRLMGKSELSKMSPFQLVIAFMIAELAAIPIDDPSVSLINGVIAIFMLMFLQILFSFLSIKSEGFKNFISGKPSILVEKGKLNIKELRRLRITCTDLMEQLRLENCPSISSVQYAIMESNGQLTVIPKADNKPVTPKDLKLAVTEGALPVIVISDGVLYQKNLMLAGFSEDELKARLTAVKILSYQQVFLAFCDENKEFHVYLYGEKNTPYALEVKI